jgi:putative transposase
MRKSRFAEEKIIKILKENVAGISAAELCRKYGFSDATFYTWKAKYGGMEVADVKKLKQLEDENNRLKKIVAELSLDNSALKDVLSKKW